MRFSPLVLLFILSSVSSFASSFKDTSEGSTAFTALKESTVKVTNGSGSIVYGKSGKKYILTNWHVCLFEDHSREVVAFLEDGTTLFGRFVKKDARTDLCAAEVTTDRPALHISKKLSLSDRVYTRGYPRNILSQSEGVYTKEVYWTYFFNIEDIGECPSEYKPYYSGNHILRGCKASFHSYVSTLYSRPGSSGSPVTNSKGELVGVISSCLDSDEESAGMVTFEDVRDFLKGL